MPQKEEMAYFFCDGIYSLDFKKLMHISTKVGYYEPLVYNRDYSAEKIIMGGINFGFVGAIKRKPFFKLISIFIVNNKDYFLVAMTGSIVALFLVNFYRRRTRSNLVLIKNQKKELERTHQALKEAQAKIIEQEKYKQAKDIAGGFAHEIRNALFPADGLLYKLSIPKNISKCFPSEPFGQISGLT